MERLAHWIDNADSYICSCCRYESNNPNKEKFGASICPKCFSKMDIGGEKTVERLTKRSKIGTAFFDDDGALIRGAGGAFHQKKDMTASFIHQRFVALDKAIDRLAAYEDTGLEPEEIKVILERYHAFRSAISDETGQPMVSWTRAGEICRAEKDGRLVVLPCKAGQTIWVESCIRGRTTRIEAPGITWIIENIERFGEEIFLSREEAEAALKKRAEADNEAD